MGGSSSPQQIPTQSSTQTRDPWAPAQPYMQQALGMAGAAANQGAPYSGPTMADVHPWQQQGQSTAMALAASEPTGSAALGSARGLAQQQVENYGLSPQLQSLLEQQQGNENPYLQQIIANNNRAINSAASGAGRYASGGHDRALAEAANPVLFQDYARRQQMQQDILQGGLQRAGQFSQLIPALDQARFANAGTMMDLGQFYSNRAQGQLSSDIDKYNATNQFPWDQAAKLNAIASGAGNLGGTTVGGVSGYVQQPTTMQKLFGGAAAGAGIGGSFGGAPGAAVGALGGGLLGML